MIFTSDNVVGASPRVIEALVAANAGAMPSYGADPLTRRVEAQLNAIFEREVETFLVATGTAANALAIASMVPPHGALLCHQESHAIDDECGAPEFFSAGAKLVGLAGVGAKLTPAAIASHLADEPGGTNHPPFRGLSLSQATECGTVYRPDEIAAIAGVAHEAGMKVHMDGARFANALLTLGCTPAEMTWRAGVDCLSFGGTKNGCLMAEAVVFFDPALARDFKYRRKRAGQTVSKGRLLSAQFDAYLTDHHWLDLARHANRAAQRLSEGLAAVPGIRLAWPTEANEVFVLLPQQTIAALRAAGAQFYEWTARSLTPANRLGADEDVVRLVCSFVTRDSEIDQFVAIVRSNAVQGQ
jgi:threonine aldolase